MANGCAFIIAGPNPRCSQKATHRVWYRMEQDIELRPDWRKYCLGHAERYAEDLRGLKCIVEVAIKPIEG